MTDLDRVPFGSVTLFCDTPVFLPDGGVLHAEDGGTSFDSVGEAFRIARKLAGVPVEAAEMRLVSATKAPQPTPGQPTPGQPLSWLLWDLRPGHGYTGYSVTWCADGAVSA